MATTIDSSLDTILGGSGLRTLFQPIVDLDTRAVVAYEALTRGPVGSAVETPDALFRAARDEGRLAELDDACRTAAFRGASDAGLTVPRGLFVNAEPEALGMLLSGTVLDFGPCVLEITERNLTGDPARLLRAVNHMRELGWSIALDDVGADSRSVALLPLIRPDVIKLDLRIVQALPDQHAAFILNAVSAHVERTGALIVAEGVEHEQHADSAIALGATLGQGWLFGRPEALPTPLPPVRGVPAGQPRLTVEGTPFDLASRGRLPRPSTAALLAQLSAHLENRALAGGDAAMVFSSFQDATNFRAEVIERYRSLGESLALVGVMGSGLSDLRPGTASLRGALGEVHLADLALSDDLQGEWSVAVVTPDFAALLAARQTGPLRADGGTEYEFVLTHDRAVVVAAAQSLALRL